MSADRDRHGRNGRGVISWPGWRPLAEPRFFQLAHPEGQALAPQAAPAAGARRIDVHAHFASPTWNKKNIDSKRAGFQQLANWTPAKAIEEMDKAGVQTAILSSTQPGVSWRDDFSG